MNEEKLKMASCRFAFMSSPASQLGSKLTAFVFTLTLLAFVVESQLTQVCSVLFQRVFYLFYGSMSRPRCHTPTHISFCRFLHSLSSISLTFFPSYLVHSCFIISLPCHLLYLTQTTGRPASDFIKGLKLAIIDHFSPRRSVGSLEVAKFPLYKFLCVVVALTAAVTFPALLWFAAMTLSSCVLFA